MSLPKLPPLYVALINNQNDHSALIAQLDPNTTFLEHFELYGSVPCTWIESRDPALIPLAQALPAFQCCQAAEAHEVQQAWTDCRDLFRVAVRPEHLDALANAATLSEFQAARAAIQAETGYPPPAP